MTGKRRIAILGAGIMGCSVALNFARRGAQVMLFDAGSAPFCAASRWNEGKIHLGYLYSGDPSLQTALHILPGSLMFRPLVEELIGTSILPAASSDDDYYLCHRDSVVPPEQMLDYLRRVSDAVRVHPDAGRYVHDASSAAAHRLSAHELANLTSSPEIVAGFRVPERSVQTNWIADRFVEALAAEPDIALCLGQRVVAARPDSDQPDGRWSVDTADGHFPSFDLVVNALWEGRMAVDQSAGMAPAGVWSNRYRQSIFLKTREALDLPCALIATGPFGDIKNYDGRNFYLSWYPDGLLVDDALVQPPDPTTLHRPDPQVLHDAVLDKLQQSLPWVARIRSAEESFVVNGGWVFAAGRGQLSDARSSLHQRHTYGVIRRGNYISIDTGKYATAPLTARELARLIFD